MSSDNFPSEALFSSGATGGHWSLVLGSVRAGV